MTAHALHERYPGLAEITDDGTFVTVVDPEPSSMPGWFHDLGIHVFPTVNKQPAVPKGTSQFDYRCTREQAVRFKEYGVPLGLFAVADSDSPGTEHWNAAYLPATPFMVTTGPYHNGSPGRGRHRYYRCVRQLPKFFHRDGHTIEFRNAGQYVVGPGSRRPDGVLYKADDWSWDVNDIPFFPSDFTFDDGSCGSFSAPGEEYQFPAVVRAGERHDQLFRLIRSCKGLGHERADVRAFVHTANNERCRPPLQEDDTFERWFERAWHLRDRPLEIAYHPLEPQTTVATYDLDTPGGEL